MKSILKLQSRSLVRLGVFNALMAATLMASPAYADFATETTPVDMRSYYPNSGLINVYRRNDGSFYLKTITRVNNDPMYSYLPDQTGVHFSREDYFNTGVNYADEDPPWNNSWSFRHGDSTDMSVTEVADTFPNDDTCTSWCNGRGQYYVNPNSPGYPDGIIHGNSAGHVLGEDYTYLMNHQVYYTSNVQQTTPTLNSNLGIWSAVKMVAKYNSYAPGYGRNGGSYGYGNAASRNNVVAMFFVHGSKGVPPDAHADSPTCSSQRPSWANHESGYVTIWQTKHMAPDVGEIEVETHFDERYCAGTSAQSPNAGYHAYLDTTTSFP